MRLESAFSQLLAAFDARRISLEESATSSDPDLVLVVETVGAVQDFVTAVTQIAGFDWLAAENKDDIQADDDFFDELDPTKQLSGQLFLVGSNREALLELRRLWTKYEENPTSDLGNRLNAWKNVFKHLKTLRFWGPSDRVLEDVRLFWRSQMEAGATSIRFEVEAWCYESDERNTVAAQEIARQITALDGRIISTKLLKQIAYHGFLIELPAAAVQGVLENPDFELTNLERIMYFRRRGQAMAWPQNQPHVSVDEELIDTVASGKPVVALLDGMPMQNHPRLTGRLQIDDPDGWESDYPVATRYHGTGMASLIIWGDLHSSQSPLADPIYVRPLLKPAAAGADLGEETPDDQLLIDLVHRAVVRMFDLTFGTPAAPTVRAINLSVGDASRPYDGGPVSPWGRLLDWLSHEYDVLFIVSAGNVTDPLKLEISRETIGTQPIEIASRLAMQSLASSANERRILSPAESINSLTVGALHWDSATSITLIATRPLLMADRGLASYSRVGPGFGRSIKPDILLPGGRVRFAESAGSTATETVVEGQWKTQLSPGQLVACPPDQQGSNLANTRGTSNSAALATRAAAQAVRVIDALRASHPSGLDRKFDAVIVKALLAHTAEWEELRTHVLDAHPSVTDNLRQRRLVARFAGYGRVDIDKALACTEQRATLIGVGLLRNKKGVEFRAPLPPSLVGANRIERRLTVTLAWISPVNPRNTKYRVASLWVESPSAHIETSRQEAEARQARNGTIQHEIFEGDRAFALVDGDEIIFRVSCVAKGGRLWEPVKFALCVSLEVAASERAPIYDEIRARLVQRVQASIT